VNAGERRPVGRRGIEITRLGLGCAPLGNLYDALDDDAAHAVVDAAWEAGIRYFDVAPLYGSGLAEERLGRALVGRPRDELVVSTKVGRRLRPEAHPPEGIFAVDRALAPVFDYSADGVRRSLDESLHRLGLDRVDIVLVHDPDDHQEEALAGAFPALVDLRDQGVVRAIGAGMNQWQALDRFVHEADLDVVLVAGRVTLLDRSATDALLPRCAQTGTAVVVGGVFNSGVLAGDARQSFDYLPAPAEVVTEVARLRAVCEGHGVPLGAAALQLPLRHPAVTGVLIGARSADELATDLGWAAVDVPDALWDELGA